MINKIKKFMSNSKYDNFNNQTWLEYLTTSPGIMKSAEHRINMTISCKDSDYIPKVKNAGQIIKKSGKNFQIMHNGVLVERGGYFGDWMEEIITKLQGHHEPQEEKAFHEVLARLKSGSSMLELGSFWSYYSLWFNKAIKNAINICAEPDPDNLGLGRRNSRINDAKLKFINSAAGYDDGKIISFTTQQEVPKQVRVPIRSVDSIVREHRIDRLDLVHMDVQGAELDALRGCTDTIKEGKLRFIFISTHHYLISGIPDMHKKCLNFLLLHGANIIAEHDIHESYSGDGLIVASFFNQDKDFKLDISHNRASNSLFRDPVEDLGLLVDYVQKNNKGIKNV